MTETTIKRTPKETALEILYILNDGKRLDDERILHHMAYDVALAVTKSKGLTNDECNEIYDYVVWAYPSKKEN